MNKEVIKTHLVGIEMTLATIEDPYRLSWIMCCRALPASATEAFNCSVDYLQAMRTFAGEYAYCKKQGLLNQGESCSSTDRLLPSLFMNMIPFGYAVMQIPSFQFIESAKCIAVQALRSNVQESIQSESALPGVFHCFMVQQAIPCPHMHYEHDGHV